MHKNRIEFAGDVFNTEERDGKVTIHIKAVSLKKTKDKNLFIGERLSLKKKNQWK